jgi:hypothetical protein
VEQSEWFDKMKQLADELHKLSHEAPQSETQSPNYVDRVRLINLIGDACDVLAYITNSSSWHSQELTYVDKSLIKDQIERVLLWGLALR